MGDSILGAGLKAIIVDIIIHLIFPSNDFPLFSNLTFNLMKLFLINEVFHAL